VFAVIIFTARCYASAVYAVYAVIVCLPSLRLSHAGKCTKTAKRRFTQTMPYDSSFPMPKISVKLQRGQP